MSYTKFHSPWGPTDPVSAKAMNWIETQYAILKSAYDAHSHDLIFYPKATADLTFFSLSFMGSGSGFDADMVDGLHYSDIVSAIMPIGAIMLWKSSDGDIPIGWGVCNGATYGSYTSPDLRDRFVIGAGGSYAVGQTGGPASWNGTITPSGSVTVGNHILTIAELPSHFHSYTEYYSPITGAGGSYSGTTGNAVLARSIPIENQSSGGGSHGHTGSTAAFTAIDPRPAYYSLYYIMKYA